MKLVSFDVETRGAEEGYGLQPARAVHGKAWLTMCAMANDKGAMGYMRPSQAQLKSWLDRCAETKTNIVAWNAPFDMAWLIAMGLREEVYANKWLDGMLLWKHLTNAPEWSNKGPKSYSLKAAVAEFMPQHAGYEENIDFNTDDPEELAALFEYNKKDASFTFALTKMFLEQMTERQKRCALLEAVCLPMVAESFVQGVNIDVEAAAALRKKLMEDADVSLVTLKLQTCDQDIDESVIASPTKLRKVLYENWGLTPPKKTPKGADSTDRDALSQLAEVDGRAKLLNDHREAKNNCKKFAEGALNSAEYNGDNIARPQPRVFGTYTGRMTYSSKVGRGKGERPSGIALHQWKRATDFRNLITVPDGYTLMEFDFSGQEFRWMAVQSGDEQMLQLCMPGEDAHSYMGSRITGEDYRAFCRAYDQGAAGYKDKRQLGKVGNLSCIAAGQQVLTDRGYISIEDVALSDKVWDGCEWVSHDGVVYQGDKDVITYAGITATPDHKVLIQDRWVAIEEAARHGWEIKPALGEGWACKFGSAFRIMGGIVRRAISDVRGAIHQSKVCLRGCKRCQPTHDGGGKVHIMQKLCSQTDASQEWQTYRGYAGAEATTETCQRDEAAVYQQERLIMEKLRRSWHRVQVFLNQTWCGIHTVGVASGIIRRSGLGSDKQQRSLRAGKSQTCNSQAECRKQATYDILNAGPRTRFVVGTRVVSNCQYRTSANTLRQVARVQYNLTLSEQQAKAIHANYQLSYPRVPEYWRNQIRTVKDTGWVETVTGRRIHVGYEDEWFRLVKSKDGEGYDEIDNTWKATSTAINFPIQGSGADQKYLALAILKNLLPKYDGRFYFELHDGLFVIVPDRYADKAAREIHHTLSNLPYKQAWGVNLPIQFPVDGKAGKSWGQLKELEL